MQISPFVVGRMGDSNRDIVMPLVRLEVRWQSFNPHSRSAKKSSSDRSDSSEGRGKPQELIIVTPPMPTVSILPFISYQYFATAPFKIPLVFPAFQYTPI